MFKSDPFKVVESSNLKNLRAILKRKPDCIHKSKNGDTLLHVAATMENSDVMEVLLQYGARVDRQNNIGRTALHISCALGHYGGVLVLREHDADPSIKCALGNNALHEASKRGNVRIIKYLFNYDFNVSAQNDVGWTALHKAVHSNHLDATEVLLREGGIDPKLTTSSSKNQTAYQMAMELMRYEIAAEIEKYEYKPSFKADVKQGKDVDTAQRVPKIDVAKVFDEGKNRISNFFRLKTNHSPNNEATNTTTTENPGVNITTVGNEHTVGTENFFKATQDKLKSLLKTKTSVNSAEDEREENDEDKISETTLVQSENKDVQNEEEQTSVQPQSSSSGVNNISNESTTTEAIHPPTKSRLPKVGLFKKKQTSSKRNTKKKKNKEKEETDDPMKDQSENQAIVHNTANDDEEDVDAENEEKDHECPVCFEIPLPPIHVYQCVNGHLYCGQCMNMPNMFNCPQCGVDISSTKMRNRYAEENIQRLYGGKKK